MGYSDLRPRMIEALDVHSRIELIRPPLEVTAHPSLPLAACVVASEGNGDNRIHLIETIPNGSPPRELTLAVSGGNPNVTLVQWHSHDVLVCATHGSDDEYSVLTGVAVPIDRGSDAEIVWETTLPGAIEAVRTGPGGILVLVAAPGTERDGSHLGTRVGHEGDPAVDRTDRARRGLYLLDAEGGSPREVSAGGLNVWSADWDRNGNIVAVTSRDPRQAGFYSPRLVRIDADTGDLVELYRTPWQLAQPRISPDGRLVLVVEGLSIVSGRVLSIDIETGEFHRWPGVDDVTDLGWMDDDRVWITGWNGTGVHVGVVDRTGREVNGWKASGSLRGTDGQPTLSPTVDGGAVAVAEGHGSPPEVAYLRLDTHGWAPLTRFNRGAEHLADGVSRTAVTWSATDGVLIEGILLRSTRTTGPQPLVVITHGGPTWLWSDAFAPAESNNLALPLVYAGAAILLPNPRGSSGRGQDFARGVIGQVGRVDLDDILAGIDHLAFEGIADPEQLSIMGLSYGGYLAGLAATVTARFRAAVVMSGVSDWLAFRTTSNLGGGYDALYHHGVGPETSEGREKLVAVSPVYQVSPDAAPTLILHGREDRTTPVVQAQMLHRSLQFSGVATELVVYPGEGHELVDVEHRADAARRVLLWLTEHGALA